MKIVFTEKIITPPIGIPLAGYSTSDISEALHDDLKMSALLLDDGARRILMVSFDLLGIDENFIKKFRKLASDRLGNEESDCIFSCTHTHCGPPTRTTRNNVQHPDESYMAELEKNLIAAVNELAEKASIETSMVFFSSQSAENLNRRYVGPENSCSFLPHRRDMERIADCVRDPEVGGVAFYSKAKRRLVYVIGNFAAHPLAGHSPGLGGLRISADYPGYFRNYIKSETGADAMFISGAAGDMVPKGHETGEEAMRSVGVKVAQSALDGIMLATRLGGVYRMECETLQSTIEKITCKVRPFKQPQLHSLYSGQSAIELELQLVSIGDVCFIGVPGELLAELGLEMKWHSPFRKTFIMYCSTAYADYLCHGNALVSGGYEAAAQLFTSRSGLELVNTAVDGAYKLYEKTFPDPEQWPENHPAPLVALKNI